MNTNQAPLLTLFEDSRRSSRSLPARRLASAASGIAATLSSDLLSFEGAPHRRRARASSFAGRAWRSRRWRRGMAWPSRDGWTTRRCCSPTARRCRRSPPSSDVLSGDVPVAPFMDVSDQVDRGRSGSRGSGGLASWPRRDSGRERRRCDGGGRRLPASLRIRRSIGKVIANVSKVTGDPSTADAHGHGTHIAGIIAGNSSASLVRDVAL